MFIEKALLFFSFIEIIAIPLVVIAVVPVSEFLAHKIAEQKPKFSRKKIIQ